MERGNRQGNSSPHPHFRRPSPSTSTNTSINYFSPGQGRGHGQGKYVIRLANLEDENLQLKSKIASLEKWKERMDDWMLEQFGVTVNAEFDRSDTSMRTTTTSVAPVSVSQNNSMENGHSPCPQDSPTTLSIVKVESLSPFKNPPRYSENLNSTANVNVTEPGTEESDAEDGSESEASVQHSESESETNVPPARSQNSTVSPVIRPRNLFTENSQTDSNHLTLAGHSSEQSPEPEPPVHTENTDSIPCDVCGSPEPEYKNDMVFCEGCNVCVHQACYGISKVPHDDWKCRTCAEGIAPGTQACLFCPNLGGAMTRCNTPSKKQWAHVSCAWWIPEITFGNPALMDTVINIPKIPKTRWNLRCHLCKIKKGACIQCYYKKCSVAFHVTCAHKHGLKMNIRDEDSNGDKNGEADPNSLIMHAFCDSHADCEPSTPTPKRRRTGTSPRGHDRQGKKSI